MVKPINEYFIQKEKKKKHADMTAQPTHTNDVRLSKKRFTSFTLDKQTYVHRFCIQYMMETK